MGEPAPAFQAGIVDKHQYLILGHDYGLHQRYGMAELFARDCLASAMELATVTTSKEELCGQTLLQQTWHLIKLQSHTDRNSALALAGFETAILSPEENQPPLSQRSGSAG